MKDKEVTPNALMAMIEAHEQEILILKKQISAKRKRIREMNKQILSNAKTFFGEPVGTKPESISLNNYGYDVVSVGK